MDEIFEITEYVQQEAGNETNLIWGNCYDESLEDKISVTVIATGFERKKPAIHIPENKSVSAEPVQVAHQSGLQSPVVEQATIEFDIPVRDESATVIFENAGRRSMEEIADDYNHPEEPYVHHPEPRTQRGMNSQTRFEPSRLDEKKMYSHRNIIEMENTPAYKRRRVHLDDPIDSSYDEGPKWSFDQENDEPVWKKNSPYLHDNVD